MLIAIVSLGCNAVERPPAPRKVGTAFTSVEIPRPPPVPERSLTENQRRFQDAAVYVDGAPVGIVKVTELPPQLKVTKFRLVDGRFVDRYTIAGYLAATGVDMARVQAVYLHGGRGRVAMITGDMMRKYNDLVRFAFTQGDRGKPRMHWPGVDGFVVNTTIDKFLAISVFVAQPPPQYDKKNGVFLDQNGKSVGEVPYVPEESLIKGSRIYADGKLVGAAKRKTLPDAWLAPGADALNERFVLLKFLESLDVARDGWRAVAVAQEDDFVAVIDGPSWSQAVDKMTFSLPKKSKGQFVLRFPEEITASDGKPLGDVRVSSLSFFRQFAPPTRELELPFERDDARGPGSTPPQADD